jgi:hypothetical protein
VTQSKYPFPMQERKEPRRIKFEREGDSIEGVLVGIERLKMDGKFVPKFVFAEVNITGDRVTPTGDRFDFLGTYDLANKIRISDVGKFLFIRYESQDASVERNGNKLRRFKVGISEAPIFGKEQVNDGTFISDEDIPF